MQGTTREWGRRIHICTHGTTLQPSNTGVFRKTSSRTSACRKLLPAGEH